MFGLIPFNFRFRGKVNRLFAIYQCFVDNPGVGLHPTQICRQTGFSLTDVSKRLDNTPELFVRLPKRDGITRYRLNSATTVKSAEDVDLFLRGAARKETLFLYAYGAMLFLLFLIIVILIGPAV